MHTPPTRNGIYAFVWPYFEPFLLQSPRLDREFEYLRDGKGNLIDKNHPEFQVNSDKYRHRVNKQTGIETLYDLRRPKIFEYYGPLWHHLEQFVDPKDVLQRKEFWVKTNFDAYVKALKKELHSVLRTDGVESMRGEKEPSSPFWQYRSKRPAQNFYRDHLEVFIDDKI